MRPHPSSFRHATPGQLAEALRAARNYTLDLFDALAAAGYDALPRVPYLATINPPLWELGHTAWFAEWFVLRAAMSSAPDAGRGHSLLTLGDTWFNSNTMPHKERWKLDLPSVGALKTYCREVLERTLDQLARENDSDAALYPYRLALAHEDMHGEAFLYSMQTLGVAPPPNVARTAPLTPPRSAIAYPGGTLLLGGAQENGFVFDNERPAHPCHVAPFQIDAGLVTNAQFTDFVRDGGYQDRRLWSIAGSAWLMGEERSAPRYWQRDHDQWRTRRFDQLSTLAGAEPVRHVNLFEAQAYCAWAERRLPSEAEWEYAATSGQAGFDWGQLWEWTASPFEPFAGFEADRYREYSTPSFGTHQVLRGASFATPARLRSAHFRNFYLPPRDDIFVGFRTCAV
jgi:iron(II)-dependent oxidoreductase